MKIEFTVRERNIVVEVPENMTSEELDLFKKNVIENQLQNKREELVFRRLLREYTVKKEEIDWNNHSKKIIFKGKEIDLSQFKTTYHYTKFRYDLLKNCEDEEKKLFKKLTKGFYQTLKYTGDFTGYEPIKPYMTGRETIFEPVENTDDFGGVLGYRRI